MFNTIKRWFTKEDQNLNERFEAVLQGIDQLKQRADTLESQNHQLSIENQHLKSEKEKEEQMRNSDEPWVVIRSDSFDPEKGIRVELDWNDAFVKQLRISGVRGSTDEVVVQKWLAFLYEDLVGRMERSLVEQPEEPQTSSEFE